MLSLKSCEGRAFHWGDVCNQCVWVADRQSKSWLFQILTNVWIVQKTHAIVIRTVKIYKEVSSAYARLASSLTHFFRPVLVRCSLVFIIY